MSTLMRVLLLPFYNVITITLHHVATVYGILAPAVNFDVVRKA